MVDLTSINIRAEVRRPHQYYRRIKGATKGIHNYVYDPNERKVKPQTDKQRGRPPTTYNYSIEIVHDPLDIGGFRKGTCFSVIEYTEMKHQCSFTPGTVLNVRGTLRVISRHNGYQVAKKCKPQSL